MSKLNIPEKCIVIFLLAWTAFHLILWVAAHGAPYTEKEAFWPFISGNPFGSALPHTYDFREFIIYTFVPWTLFLMADKLLNPTKDIRYP
jgi:hypothetical protein